MSNITKPVVQLDAERFACGLEIPEPPRGHRPTADLSFMTEGDYWSVDPTGSSAKDFKLGHQLADEFLAYIGEYPSDLSATLLSSIVRTMIGKVVAGQEFGGLHVAFLGRVGRYAMATAAIMELGQ